MSTPLFKVLCHEPKGDVLHKVTKLEFTPENLAKLWEKQKKYKVFLGREISTFDQFIDFFVIPPCINCGGPYKAKGICFLVGDFVGIFWLSDITPPAYAEVHYTFFDGRIRGRENLVREALRFGFENYNINRFYVRIGNYAPIPRAFAVRIGFKREGILRKCMFFDNQWFDADCYSILRSEASQWDQVEMEVATSPK